MNHDYPCHKPFDTSYFRLAYDVLETQSVVESYLYSIDLMTLWACEGVHLVVVVVAIEEANYARVS